MQRLQQQITPSFTSKKPSKKLEKLIDSCALQLGKTLHVINAALKQGRLEGFDDRTIGDMIKRKMIAAGFTDRTVRRYLPASAKHMKHASIHKTTTITTASRPDILTGTGHNYQQELQQIQNHISSIKSETKNKTTIKQSEPEPEILSGSNTSLKSKQKNRGFLFNATVSHMGPRFVISIPTKHNSDITKFVGKELDVIINIQEGMEK